MNRLAKRAALSAPARDNPVDWRPWGQTRSPRPAPRTGRSCSRSATPPATGATSWPTRASRTRKPRRVMNDALRQHQGRPRGAARRRPYLYERAPCPRRAGRLAAHHVPDAEGEPFWGGTYFPKEPRFGRPGFVADPARGRPRLREPSRSGSRTIARILLKSLAAARLAARSAELAVARSRPRRRRSSSEHDRSAEWRLRRRAEIPQPAVFEFLWRAHRPKQETERYREACSPDASSGWRNGGIYDHLGGGFARYSVDERWLVPHFEKMLYDNAQLLELLRARCAGDRPGPVRDQRRRASWPGSRAR